MGSGSFPGVKRPGLGVNHRPPSSAEVEGRVEIYICSPSGHSWLVIGWTVPLAYYVQEWTVQYAVSINAQNGCVRSVVHPFMFSSPRRTHNCSIYPWPLNKTAHLGRNKSDFWCVHYLDQGWPKWGPWWKYLQPRGTWTVSVMQLNEQCDRSTEHNGVTLLAVTMFTNCHSSFLRPHTVNHSSLVNSERPTAVSFNRTFSVTYCL
jgi:hypothetical protein